MSLHVVSFEDFVAVQEPSAEAIIGTQEETILAADSTLVMYGAGGAGKTTLAIDGAAHWASGSDWLGVHVERPLRVLLIENEGPRGKFRQKLERKRDTWDGPPFADNVHVVDEPWGRLSFAEETHREELARTITELDIDIVVAGPVKRLGMKGGGTPDEVTAFSSLLMDLRGRLERPVAFVLIHHENKAGDVSGAWEGEPDTLVHVRSEGSGRTALTWEKARWSSSAHGTKTVLRWLTASEGFEVVESEVDLAARRTEIRNAVLATLEEHPGQPTEHVIKRVGKKAGTVREELKKLEIAGTAYRTPSEYTDALGRPRTCSGWFLSAHAGSYAVPLPGTTWDAELSVPVARPAVPHPKGGTGYEGRPTEEPAAAGQEPS